MRDPRFPSAARSVALIRSYRVFLDQRRHGSQII